MRKIKTLIVDDESDARDLLNNILKNNEDIEIIACVESAEEALNWITKTLPDLVFLDVQMPNKNGFDLLDDLKKLKITYPEIVFVTAFDQFALKAIKHSAFDFLLKPIDIDELEKTIHKFKTKTLKSDFVNKIDVLFENLSQNKKLKFNTRHGFMTLNPNEIVYCSADGSYTQVYLKNSKLEIFTNHIGYLVSILPVTNFFRISRSQIINTKYLFSVIRKEKICILKDGENEIILYISSSKLKELEEFF